MKRSILITGITGSGKSTIAHHLGDIGYKAYDIENIPDLYRLLNKETGEPFLHHSNEDLNDVKRAHWICDRKELEEIIKNEKEKVAFYCGTGSNIEDLFSLFDAVILLRANKTVVQKRLESRPLGSYGKNLEIQSWIFEGKEHVEQRLIDMGAIPVNADCSIEEVIKAVLIIADCPKSP